MRNRFGTDSLLVVTPCSASKIKLPVFDGAQEELWSSVSTSQESNGAPRGIAARDMYVGRHHKSVMESVDRLRAEFCHVQIGVVIVSAGYGLLEEWDQIEHYDESFDRMTRTESIDTARRLGIRDQLAQQLDEYKYVLFLLSDKYLNAIEAPMGIAYREIYFAGKAFKSDSKGISIEPAGREEAK